MKFTLLISFAALCVFAQDNLVQISNKLNDENIAVMNHVEELRAIAIQNRRIICGRILKVLPDGIVVDSGYTNLMRAPVNQSWLIPGTVVAERAANVVEEHKPDSVCFGQVFLTDLPKAPGRRPKAFDFVILEGFPMGQYTYNSVGGLNRTVRKFSTKVANAVRWMSGQEEEKQEKENAPQK